MSDSTGVRFTRKGLATRSRIIDTAAKLMFARGVAGTSIDDVRSAAVVSGSQISHYFHDKGDLTRRVVAARRNDIEAFHTRPQLGDLDSLEALRAWVEACMANVDAVYRRGGCVYGSLAAELMEADEQIHDDLSAGYDRWLELFRTGLTKMRRRGDLRPDADPRHLAVALVSAHQGGAMITYVTGSPDPLRAALDAAVDYVQLFAAVPEAHRSRRRPMRRKRKS